MQQLETWVHSMDTCICEVLLTPNKGIYSNEHQSAGSAAIGEISIYAFGYAAECSYILAHHHVLQYAAPMCGLRSLLGVHEL